MEHKALLVFIISLILGCPLLLQGQNQALFFEEASRLEQEPSGALWIGGDNGLIYYDPVAQQDIHFRAERGRAGSLQGDTIYQIVLRGAMVYLATNAGFEAYDKANASFLFFPPLHPDTGAPVYYSLGRFCVDHSGKVWMGGHSGCIRYYDPLQNKAINLDIKTDKGEVNDMPLKILEDKDSALWILDSTHLWRLSPNRKQLERYTATPIDMGVAAGQKTEQLLYQGQSGSVWIGTPDALRFDPREAFFRFYQFFNTDWNAEATVAIYDLYQDEDGTLWCGTGKGLYGYDLETGDTTHYFTQRHIQSVAPMQDGRLVLANWGTVYVFDPATEQAVELFSEDGEFEHSRTLDARFDQDGDLWVATDGTGLWQIKEEDWDQETGIITRYKQYRMDEAGGSISANHLFRSFVDSKNQIWALVDVYGLSRIDKNSATVKVFSYDPNDPYSISSGYTLDATEDEAGNIWITTKGNGLNKYSPQTGKFTRYDVSHGLQDNSLNRIAIDSEEKIWVTTSKGLSRFDPATETFTNYDQNDGLVSWKSALYANKETGDVFAGGPKGFHAFNIHELQSPVEQPSPIKIARLSYFNSKTDEMTKVEPQTLKDGRLTLTHRENIIEADFAILDLFDQSKHSYQYSWVSFGEAPKWTALGDQNQVRLINLEPGQYTFSVKGRNSMGVWNELEEPIHIRIRSPWWATKAAYLAYFFLAITVITLIYRFQLNRQQVKAEALRLKEMNSLKSRLYTNFTHEFRTPLTIIMGMIENIRGHEKERQLIHRNSHRLLRMVNQLLDLARLESGNLSLNLVQGNIIAYLRYLSESFHSTAADKQIRLAFKADVPELIMDFDEDKLQQIVYNLLSNALKFTSEGGKVDFQAGTLSQNGQPYLQMKVADTGIGISPSQLPHIFDRFYQADGSATRKGEGTGIGLAFTRELVNFLGGTISVKSKPGEGTAFTLRLPAKQGMDTPPLEQAAKSFSPDEVALPGKQNAPHSSPEQVRSPGAEPAKDTPILLIIEDNADVTDYIESLLQKEYRIEKAANGQAGIDKALAIIPDIIITDVMMPEKDGYEVCATLKTDERTSHIPIVMLTAKATEADRLAGLQTGADAYLMKPFNKKELFIRLEKLVELRRVLRQRYTNAAGPLGILGLSESEAPKEPSLDDLFLEKVRHIVEEKIGDAELDLTYLCQATHLSSTQLFRKMKALTGEPPMSFIRKLRLHKAKELLQTTGLNISEIAYSLGFTDPHYFSRAFKKEFGGAPSAFRK